MIVELVASAPDIIAMPDVGNVQGDPTGGSLSNLVKNVIQILGLVAGVGFLVWAAFAGLKKGSSHEKGKDALAHLAWGAGIATLFILLPGILGMMGVLGEGFF